MEKERSTKERRDELIKENYKLMISNEAIKRKIKLIRKENHELFTNNIKILNLLNLSKI